MSETFSENVISSHFYLGERARRGAHTKDPREATGSERARQCEIKLKTSTKRRRKKSV